VEKLNKIFIDTHSLNSKMCVGMDHNNLFFVLRQFDTNSSVAIRTLSWLLKGCVRYEKGENRATKK
jgi:hypothetical protein